MAELLILGSGTGLPNKKRAAPGYFLRVEDRYILLDSGSGTLQRLFECGVTYQDIDYILYSHLHPDHTLDLASILFAARNPRGARKKDMVVIGPKGIEDFYNSLLSLYGTSIAPESYKVIFKEIQDGEIDLGMCRIFVKALEHSDRSIGFRIGLKDNTTLAYSGDTDYCENIVSLANGVELLILECSFPNEHRVEGHLTPSLAGKIASKAGCKRLLLTHFYPICDGYPILRQCREDFKGKVTLAKDYMRLKL